MNYIFKRFAQFFSFTAVLTAPLIVSAQTVSNVQGLFAFALNILNQWVVPILFALAFIMFLYGVYRYFIAGGDDEEKVKTGQRFVMWSVIGFALMFTIWGVINLLINTIPFGSANEPGLPQFSANGLNTTSFTTSSISSIFNLLGGGNSNSNSSLLIPSSGTISSNGTNYTITGANTVQSQNGTCPLNSPTINWVLAGTQCQATSASNAAASGSVASGGSCVGNANACQSGLVCQQTANGNNTCVNPSTAAPQNASLSAGGDCENNPQACAAGLVCASNSNGGDDICVDSSSYQGDIACGVGTVPSGSTCAQCSDGTTAATAAQCPGGSASGTNPQNGSLGAGGDCENNPQACGSGLVCASNSNGGDDICVDSSAYQGDVACGVGQVPAGSSCAQCSDGTTASDPSLCPYNSNTDSTDAYGMSANDYGTTDTSGSGSSYDMSNCYDSNGNFIC